MSIVRAPRPPSSYYVLDNRIINDDRLSWAARGLLVFLLSKPDHWKVSVEHLRRQTDKAIKSTGKDGVYALLNELERNGYIKREQPRMSDGTLAALEYHVNESPLRDLPEAAEPYPVNPTLAITEKADKTKKAAKERGADAPVNFGIDLPLGIDEEAWADWHRYRSVKAGWTSHAKTLSANKLLALAADGYSQRALVDQSIERGWTSFFPIAQDRNTAHNSKPSKQLSAILSVAGINPNEVNNSAAVVSTINPQGADSTLRPQLARLPGF